MQYEHIGRPIVASGPVVASSSNAVTLSPQAEQHQLRDGSKSIKRAGSPAGLEFPSMPIRISIKSRIHGDLRLSTISNEKLVLARTWRRHPGGLLVHRACREMRRIRVDTLRQLVRVDHVAILADHVDRHARATLARHPSDRSTAQSALSHANLRSSPRAPAFGLFVRVLTCLSCLPYYVLTKGLFVCTNVRPAA